VPPDPGNPSANPGGLAGAAAAADAGMAAQPACSSVATCGTAGTPPAPPAPTPVAPILTINNHIVLVRKSYLSKSTRMPVVLATDQAFDGTGTFTSSSGAIRFFTQDSGGTEIESGHSFAGAALSSSVTIYAEGAKASASMNDVTLTLALKPGSKPVKPPLTDKMTAVEVFLDICQSRTAAGADPTPLSDNDKINTGRFIHLQVKGGTPQKAFHGRAMLIVRKAKPDDFTGQLVLWPIGTRVQLFQLADDPPDPAQAALASPQQIPNAGIPAAGTKFWAEGTMVSGALRDTGFDLGVVGVASDGDRACITVVSFSNFKVDIPVTPARTPRLGNSPVARHHITRGHGALAARAFDEDFTANLALALIEDSVPAADLVKLSVQIHPAGAPISWSVQRDARPAPDGDDPDVIALSPNTIPSVKQTGANTATVAADAVGSFHVRPYIDCNGTKDFEYNDNTGKPIDREPFIILNLILVRVQGTRNVSKAQPGNLSLNPAAPTNATGVGVSTGTFASAGAAGVHNRGTVEVIGGGGDGLRGLTFLFGGWVNNELAVAGSPSAPATEDVLSNYRDPAPPNTVHPRFSVWAQPPAHGIFQVIVPPPPPPPPPAPPPPPVVMTVRAGPVLDCSPFGAEGTGGNTCVGTETAANPGPPTPIRKVPRSRPVGAGNLGQLWTVEQWDSPGDNCPANHEASAAAVLINYRFNLNFRTDLVFWTNNGGVPGPSVDPACRLYSTVFTNTWRIRFACTFPAAGPAVIGTALTITMNPDTGPMPKKARPVQGTGLEVRGPVSLRLLCVDARN
jgi:hypothetical protein